MQQCDLRKLDKMCSLGDEVQDEIVSSGSTIEDRGGVGVGTSLNDHEIDVESRDGHKDTAMSGGSLKADDEIKEAKDINAKSTQSGDQQ